MQFFELSALNCEFWLLWAIYWIIAGFFSHRNKLREGIVQRFGHIIPLYGGFWLIFHGRHPPFFGRLYSNHGLEAFGDLLTACGLIFAIWARLHLGKYWSGVISLKENHRVIRTGPYELVRHPIYTGLILAAAGSAITNSTVDGFIGLVLIIAACFYKAKREESLLTAQLGDEYRQFKNQVPFLVPYRVLSYLKQAIAHDNAG